MKIIRIRQTFYRCEICKTDYKKRTDAEKCEKRILEERPFRICDTVQNVEPRQCGTTGRQYFFKGIVTKVTGPVPIDEECEIKWLRSPERRLNGHVFEYQVKFSCPCCPHEKKSAEYYTPELKLI